jgi:hypothetical protein
MKKIAFIVTLIGLLGVFGVQGATATDSAETCANGGVCELGDIGPGGGMVFYVRTQQTVQVWRATPNAEKDLGFNSNGWKYLEVAPKTWSGGANDPKLKWCNKTNTRAAWTTDLQGRDWNYKWVPGKKQTGFLAGTGFGNSETIAQNCNSGAATAARKYRGGGKSDWYLPRQTELNQLTMYAGGKLNPVSACCIKDFPKKQNARFKASPYSVNWGSAYWVSSFSFGNLPNQDQGQDRMLLGSNSPSSGLPFVRPIRAF